MYQQERMDQIMKILKKNHYVTVEYLANELRYSPASIRRDLTLLQKQGLVSRSYGGVSIRDDRGTPFRFRQHSMRVAKNKIAKDAATLVKNGDTVFIDNSSTSQYVGHFLLEKKGITVVTNNMALASFLGEHGITTYCTGGKVYEHPGLLNGVLTNHGFSMFNADICFFSTSGVSSDGRILIAGENMLGFIHNLRQHSKKMVFLCGSDKFNSDLRFTVFGADKVEYFISDKPVPDEWKTTYPDTKFICTTDK